MYPRIFCDQAHKEVANQRKTPPLTAVLYSQVTVNQSTIRAIRIRARAYQMRRRVRFARRRIEQISRTATLGGLFLSFFKIGLVGFGGGVAVLAQSALTVRKRRWLTDSEFVEAVALAQSLPGTSAGNSVTYIRMRLRGWRGATVVARGAVISGSSDTRCHCA